MSSGGIDAAFGYLIYPDKRSDTTAPLGLVLRDSISPGIFKYLTDE